MDIFSALADPTRRKIVEMLAQEGRLSATEISARFPVSPPAISQHLKVLREANLVFLEKHAQQRIYRINPETFVELEDWTRQVTQLWNERFDALDQVLQAEKNKQIDLERIKEMTQTPVKEVTITRIFDAPRDLVFKAWTDPNLMSRWYGPKYFTSPRVELDVRPGGEWQIDMQGPDGVIYPGKGVYQEVAAPERLVFTSTAIFDEQGVPQLETRNTVILEDLGGKTKLTLHIVVVKAGEIALAPLSGMEIGWNMSLDKLAEMLVQASARS